MMRRNLVLLILLSFLQLCIGHSTRLTVGSSCDSLFASSHGEVLVDGVSYYVLQGDFHMHTTYSDGSNMPLDMVLEARELGYDFVAITDHDNIGGALGAKDEVERYGIHIVLIIGEEVTVEWGHLLALGINQDILGFSPEEVCREIHDQGGYAVPAHPLVYWSADVFKFLIENHYVDAYEAYSGANWTSQALSATYVVAEYAFIGNSDAHSIDALGYCNTIVFSVNKTINGILDAVLNHRTVVKWHTQYIGNVTLVNIVKDSLEIFEAKTAIGSAEASIIRAKATTYLIKPDLDKADEFLEDSMKYYEVKDYQNAISVAKQVEDSLSESVTLEYGVTIIFLLAATVAIALIIYKFPLRVIQSKMDRTNYRQLGLFLIGLILGALLVIFGSIWVEFYLEHVNGQSWQSWLLNTGFLLVTIILVALCVICFITTVKLFRRADARLSSDFPFRSPRTSECIVLTGTRQICNHPQGCLQGCPKYLATRRGRMHKAT